MKMDYGFMPLGNSTSGGVLPRRAWCAHQTTPRERARRCALHVLSALAAAIFLRRQHHATPRQPLHACPGRALMQVECARARQGANQETGQGKRGREQGRGRGRGLGVAVTGRRGRGSLRRCSGCQG